MLWINPSVSVEHFLTAKPQRSGQHMRVLLIQPIFQSLKLIRETLTTKDSGASPGVAEQDASRFRRTVKRITFPLGLLNIGTVLDRNGIETKIIDLDRRLFYYGNNPDVEEKSFDNFIQECLIDEIRKYQPEVIGLSGNLNTVAQLNKQCCEEIRKFKDDIKIVVGGHYYTSSFQDILISNCVDYVVLGEGEYAMLEIVNAIQEGNEISLLEHPNIVLKRNLLNGSVSSESEAAEHALATRQKKYTNPGLGKQAAIIPDLNLLPRINYSLLEDLEDYFTSEYDMHMIYPPKFPLRAIQMMTSRGCPHSCTYCSSWNVHGKKLRAISPDQVVDELFELVEKFDVNTIVFEDDLFTYSKKRTIEMCQKIVEGFGDRFTIDFPNAIAVYTLDEEVIYWLAKAGMKQINIAVESGSQFVQDTVIKKRLKLEKVKPVVDLLRKHGVLVRAYFILGFPGETLDMMNETIDFAKEIKADWASFAFAQPVVGSELYYTAARDGHLVDDDEDNSTYLDTRLQSDQWTVEELVATYEKANFFVNYLENYNLKMRNYEKSQLIFSDIVKNYPDHLLGNYCLWQSNAGVKDEIGMAKTEKQLKKLIQTEKNKSILKKFDLSTKEPFASLLG